MMARIFENRFVLIWLTILWSVVGAVMYDRMPLELLPGSSDERYAMIFPSDGNVSTQSSERLIEATKRAISQLGVPTQYSVESNSKRVLVVVNPSQSTKGFKLRLEKAMTQALGESHRSDRFVVVRLTAASSAVMTIAIASKDKSNRSLPRLSSTIDSQVIPRLDTIAGVARLEVAGLPDTSKTYSPIIEGQLETKNSTIALVERLSDYLKPSQVIAAASGAQVELESLIRRQKLDDITLAKPDGPTAQTRVSGVLASKNVDAQVAQPSLLNGDDVALISIFRQDYAFDIDVSGAVHAFIKEFNSTNTEFELVVVNDVADYIRAAGKNVTNNLRDGTLLTCLCVLIFVRSMKKTLLIALSIPISVLMAFPIMSAFGMSRNLMTMAGVTLAVGIVVDAALSVIQDMEEHLEAGKAPLVSALKSARANLLPLAITALTTLAVFVPILFLDGLVGTLFYDLSLTFIIAQLTSFVAAVFITPAIAALLYEKIPFQKVTFKPYAPWERTKESLERVTRAILSSSTASGVVSVSFLLGVVWSFSIIPAQEFLPRGRSGEYRFVAQLGEDVLPPGRLALLHKADKALEDLGFETRIVNYDAGRIVGDFKANGTEEVAKVEATLAKDLAPYRVIVSEKNPLDSQSSEGADLEFYIPIDVHANKRAEFKVEIERTVGVRDQLWSQDVKETALLVNKQDARFVSNLVPLSLFGKFWQLSSASFPIGLELGEKAKVINFAKVEAELRTNPFGTNLLPNAPSTYAEGMAKFPVRSYYLDGRAVEKVTIAVRGRTSTEVANDIKTHAHRIGIEMDMGESVKENEASMRSLFACLGFAIILIFGILFAQNQSMITSIIVMFTFVWGPLGAFPGLVLHNETLNGSALVGFILLAGTIINNGILLMDLVSRYRKRQMSPVDCCIQAMNERALNVIVTSLTTIFGMLPMVFDTGEGSQMYRALSIVVVYGTFVSTPISLIGIPCLVTFFGSTKEAYERLRLKLLIAATFQARSHERKGTT